MSGKFPTGNGAGEIYKVYICFGEPDWTFLSGINWCRTGLLTFNSISFSERPFPQGSSGGSFYIVLIFQLLPAGCAGIPR